MSNHLTFLLLRSDFGGSITFPMVWIVRKATTLKSSLFRQGIEGVLCPDKVANKRGKTFWLEVHLTDGWVLQRLPLCSLLLYKVHALCFVFFPLWQIVTKIWNRVERYSLVFLQPPTMHLVGILAANSSRATEPLQWNDWRHSTFCSRVDVTTALVPFSPELGCGTTWRRFRAIFEFSAGHKKLRIQQNVKIFRRIKLNSKWIYFSEKRFFFFGLSGFELKPRSLRGTAG